MQDYDQYDEDHQGNAQTEQYSDQDSEVELCLERKDGEGDNDGKSGCYGNKDDKWPGVTGSDP